MEDHSSQGTHLVLSLVLFSSCLILIAITSSESQETTEQDSYFTLPNAGTDLLDPSASTRVLHAGTGSIVRICFQSSELTSGLRTQLFCPPGESKKAILFFYTCTLLWGYPTYLFWVFLAQFYGRSSHPAELHIMPLSFNTLRNVHMTFLVGNALMWFLFVKSSMMNPGLLPRDTDEYYQAIRQVDYLNYQKEDKTLLNRLCHVCHLVKPLRAKHCHTINRCVTGFDHYCPFIYNTVGYRNRPYFVGFLTTLALNSAVGIYLCWNWFNVMGHSIFIGIGFLFLCVIAVISAIMASMCVYMVAVNLTTTEYLNPTKYTYLLNNQGKFFNPFDRGIILNFMEFFHIINPLTENELRTAEPTLV